MGMFQKITDAILGKKSEKAANSPAPASAAARPARPAPRPSGTAAPAPPPSARPAAMSEVDVEKRLSTMPGADKLNWRSSIVDLMKLVDVDSSYGNRKELAKELGRDDYAGSAEDNIWLHRRTMQELARNGGKVPSSYLD